MDPTASPSLASSPPGGAPARRGGEGVRGGRLRDDRGPFPLGRRRSAGTEGRRAPIRKREETETPIPSPPSPPPGPGGRFGGEGRPPGRPSETFVLRFRRQSRMGSLTGAVRLRQTNAGVQRPARRGRKPRVERKGKSPFDPDPFSRLRRGESPAYRSSAEIPSRPRVFGPEVSEKLPKG